MCSHVTGQFAHIFWPSQIVRTRRSRLATADKWEKLTFHTQMRPDSSALMASWYTELYTSWQTGCRCLRKLLSGFKCTARHTCTTIPGCSSSNILDTPAPVLWPEHSLTRHHQDSVSVNRCFGRRYIQDCSNLHVLQLMQMSGWLVMHASP